MKDGTRIYEQDDKEEVLNIFLKVWGEEACQTQKLFWDWKHSRDTIAENDGQISHVIVKNGIIAGYNGAIPNDFRIGSKVFKGCYCMDTIVLPDYRGAGIRLVRNHLAEVQLLVGGGNFRNFGLFEKITAKFTGRQSMKSLEPIRMVLIYDPTIPISKKKLLPILSKILSYLWRKALSIYTNVRVPRKAKDIKMLEINRFPDAIDAFCNEFGRRFECIGIRNREFLNWRFAEAPLNYEMYLALDGSDTIVGYMVYRHTQAFGRKAIILCECCSCDPSGGQYSFMLDFLHTQAKLNGTGIVMTLKTNHAIFDETLRKYGYLPKPVKHILVGGRIDGNEEEKDLYYNPEKWYATPADSDYEFLFFRQY
ncbi:MAG: hypothetical protein GF344_03535 [Chitinivibrionales bacterium]|nr:hypothetical protein [Chitinivibrionales bacterium]MBD3356143.1 hypothetical protein [Chitinivibrionales bacterium]